MPTEGGQAVVAGDKVMSRARGRRVAGDKGMSRARGRRGSDGAGMYEKWTRDPLRRNRSQSTVCGLAWKRYARQTRLRDVAPALNGQASLARVRPCRTGAASFMVARARGRARQRA